MVEHVPSQARRVKKVAQYDDYGNYLGDIREDELVKNMSAHEKEPSASTIESAPLPLPASELQPSLPGFSASSQPTDSSIHAISSKIPRKLPARPRWKPSGPVLYCGVDTTLLSTPSRCTFSTHSELELMLHRADRHLLYPPGGMEELKRRDPMRMAEEREKQVRLRKGGTRAADGPADSTIFGLNIRLDTPELMEEWIRQRRKRFPTSAVIAQKQVKHQARLLRDKRSAQTKDFACATSTGTEPHKTPARDTSASQTHDSKQGFDLNRDMELKEGPNGHGKETPAASTEDSSSSDKESDSSSASGGKGSESGDSDSNSDMDSEADAISSKIEPRARPDDEVRSETRQGQKHAVSENTQPVRRVRPRNTASNPFQVPDLLRQLLEREILQHVDALSQCIQFILDNDMLTHVERSPGEAQQQRKQRSRVVVVGEQTEEIGEMRDTNETARPALPRVASPALRALDELEWPDEPDPLIYLDPLRAADPKPLRHEELMSLATDTQLRAILQPISALHPYGEEHRPLRRALESWAALPTPRHREAALQLILGVGADSPMHAHEAYAPAYQRARVTSRGTSMRQNRPIGETELFRLGLRVGPGEARLIQHIAERVSVVTAGLEYAATAL